MDSQKKSETRARNDIIFARDERKIRDIEGFETFSFADCQAIENLTRSKRHALINAADKLSEQQEEMLRTYFLEKQPEF